jgi:cytochrome c oxidase subunit 2
MVDSQVVLAGQTVIYTSYVLAILLLMGWFALRVTRPGRGGGLPAVLFYSFVAFLVVVGVSLHVITYHTIPWASLDLKRASITPDRLFEIKVQDHRFLLPEETLTASCGEDVLFRLRSADLTYGFGLFRADDSMVCQMQVVPGHDNDLLWRFEEPGVYSIRSTEYSGPAGFQMVVPGAVRIVSDQAALK